MTHPSLHNLFSKSLRLHHPRNASDFRLFAVNCSWITPKEDRPPYRLNVHHTRVGSWQACTATWIPLTTLPYLYICQCRWATSLWNWKMGLQTSRKVICIDEAGDGEAWQWRWGVKWFSDSNVGTVLLMSALTYDRQTDTHTFLSAVIRLLPRNGTNQFFGAFPIFRYTVVSRVDAKGNFMHSFENRIRPWISNHSPHPYLPFDIITVPDKIIWSKVTLTLN